MDSQTFFILAFFAFFLANIAMKLLLKRSGFEVNAIVWGPSYTREFKAFAELCREEPYPARFVLRIIQAVYVGSLVISLLFVLHHLLSAFAF
jgi:hypothetical protein